MMAHRAAIAACSADSRGVLLSTDHLPDVVTEKAIDWFVRRDGGALTPSEQSALQDWLADPEHRAAFTAVERLWSDLDRIPSLGRGSSVRARERR